MTTSVIRHPSDFNYGFRPTSYFYHLDPTTVIVASILGEERRKDVVERLASGNFNPLVWGEWITESKLDDSTRKLIGSSHPRFMGGEYLDSLEEDEIEIARIVLASVTQDVISIRAKRRGKRIYYQVVDEYEGLFELSRCWSNKPLTLGELIEFISSSEHEDDPWANGLVFSHIDYNLDAGGEGSDGMRNFVSVSSSFYPELGRYFYEAITQHLDEYDAKNADEEEYAEEEDL